MMQRYDFDRGLLVRDDAHGRWIRHDDAQAEIARLTRERDEALAKVAAAFEAAANVYENGFPAWDTFSAASYTIRALTPADATAALTRIKAQERAAGMREAAGICEDDGCAWDWAGCRDAILARADAVERGE